MIDALKEQKLEKESSKEENKLQQDKSADRYSTQMSPSKDIDLSRQVSHDIVSPQSATMKKVFEQSKTNDDHTKSY